MMMFGSGGGRQYGRMELERGQHVLFVPDIHAAVAPRVGQLQRFEVVAKAPLSGPGHRDQTEVAELRARVYGAGFALDHHGHVQLLQEQLDHLAGRRRRADVQLQAGRMRQTGVVGGAHLRKTTPRTIRSGTMTMSLQRREEKMAEFTSNHNIRTVDPKTILLFSSRVPSYCLSIRFRAQPQRWSSEYAAKPTVKLALSPPRQIMSNDNNNILVF